MKFLARLIPSEFARGQDPAQEAWGAETDDGRALELIVWGRGTEARPLRLLVRISSELELSSNARPVNNPDPAKEPTFRRPTVDELQECINHAAPEGALFSLGTLPSMGRDAAPADFPEGTRFVGMLLFQIGAMPNSEASRGNLILTPGGMTHAH